MGKDEMICQKLGHGLRFAGRTDLTPEECAHLESCESCMDAMLGGMLESKPAVAVPSNFAPRVASAVPQDGAALWRPRFPGLTTALVVAAAMLLFAGAFAVVHPPHLAPNWLGIVLESATALEAGGLALWLAKEVCT